jgi:hypothetical protein
MAPTDRSRAAVQDAKIGPDKDIPHVTAPIIVKDITDLQLARTVISRPAERNPQPCVARMGAVRQPARCPPAASFDPPCGPLQGTPRHWQPMGLHALSRCRDVPCSGAEQCVAQLLARPPRQAIGIGDQDTLALQANPTAVGEIGERLVDRLTRGADQLRDLFLGQVVRDSHRVTLLGAESLRQLQQLLGHPAGHVGGDQIGQIVVGATQPAGQDSKQLLSDLRAIGDSGAQHVAVH